MSDTPVHLNADFVPHPPSVWGNCECCWAGCDCGCVTTCPVQRVWEQCGSRPGYGLLNDGEEGS